MRTLVINYSLTGHSRTLAQACAAHLGADTADITSHYGRGTWSYIRAASESWLGRLPRIDVNGPDAGGYDFVLVLGPVWAGHAATPVRAFLSRVKGRLPRTAFVLTCGGNCPASAFDEMSRLGGVTPEATFVVLEKDATASALPPALAAFLSNISPR